MEISPGPKEQLRFSKYSGAGNDFLLVDNRTGFFPTHSASAIRHLCNRRVGIGADGVLLLEKSTIADYKMRIFNADGYEASMCGNGLRCFKAYLEEIGAKEATYRIEISGRVLTATTTRSGWIRLGMGEPLEMRLGVSVRTGDDAFAADFVNTGVPHLVLFVDDVAACPVGELGPRLRHHPDFSPHGVNVNFVQGLDRTSLRVRTYERGVEGETLACGTGCTAAALSLALRRELCEGPIDVQVASGDYLKINFIKVGSSFREVTLEGPATLLFRGCWFSPLEVD